MASPLSDQLIEQFMRSIRNQFYKDHERLFFQERRMLLQALTYPAYYLQERGVGLPAARYKSVLTTIIRTINEHGDLKKVRSPGRYLLHAVQEHMLHHGEDYYEIGKATRNALEDVMRGLKPRTRGAILEADSPVPALSEAHRLLAVAKGGRKKSATETPSSDLQPDFFGDAMPLQSRRKPRA